VPDRRTIRIFISSPSDVRPERLKAEQIIARLDREFAYHFRVEAVLWEREPLVATHHFQDERNIPQPRRADIVVVILWSQLGIALPEDRFRGAISGRRVTGTEWEFEDALASARERGVPDLLLYRKLADPEARGSSEALRQRAAQLDLVEDFIERWFRAEQGEGFTTAWHDFSTVTEFEERLYDHLRELLERRAGAHVEGGEIRWHEAPFRGLLAFEYEHAPVFFGRIRARNDLRELLARRETTGCAFVLVLGASGSGKSSLLKAGLLPDLMLYGMIGRVALVRYAQLRPSDAPADLVGALAAALLTATAVPQLATLHYPQQEVAALLREAPARTATPIRQGLAEAARMAQPPLVEQAEARLVIIVDQLEELFTLDGIDAAEREAFVVALDALARSGLVWIFATMRSDFYDRLELMPSLARLAAGEARYNLLPPDDAELSQIIRQPALEAGLRFAIDPRIGVSLDAVILQAATKDRGALPLLSFLLDQLWQRRSEHGELTFEGYQELGGLEGALGRRAEEVFAAQPKKAQAALPRLLRALVTVGQDTQAAVAARPAPAHSFPEGSAEGALVAGFLSPEARLLVADEDDAGRARIRISHEALLTHWSRASEHIAQDRNDLRTRAGVEAAEAEWRAAGSQRGYLLRDPLLTNAIDLARRWREELAADLREFVARSAAAAKAAVRRRWTIAAAVMLLLVGLVVASIGALFVAEQQRNDALIAQSRFLARDSHAATTAGDATLGQLLALEALPHSVSQPDRPFLLEAEGALEDALANRRERSVLLGHEGPIRVVSFSPAGKRLLTGSDDGTAWLWDIAAGTTIVVLRGHGAAVTGAAFSPDGKRVITGSKDGTARLWNAETGAPLAVLEGHERPVLCVAFSPNGSRVATTSEDSTARLWDVETGAALIVLGGHLDAVPTVQFSPDGKQVLTASDDGTARLWDATTGATLAVLRGHEGALNSAAFSLDGKAVVTVRRQHCTPLGRRHRRRTGRHSWSSRHRLRCGVFPGRQVGGDRFEGSDGAVVGCRHGRKLRHSAGPRRRGSVRRIFARRQTALHHVAGPDIAPMESPYWRRSRDHARPRRPGVIRGIFPRWQACGDDIG
jgi:WD domain, G-beta repeat